MMSNNISWLMTTPSGDCNFKNALKRATNEEIRATIANLDGKSGAKTKLKVLEAELRRRARQVIPCAENATPAYAGHA